MSHSTLAEWLKTEKIFKSVLIPITNIRLLMRASTVVRFLKLARDRGASVTGLMLQTLALKEAKRMGVQPFEASDCC